MPRQRPVCCLGGALTDHDLGADMRLASPAAARPRNPQHATGAQACGKLASQSAAALHIKRLVNGLVADAHGLVIWKVEPKTPGNLLRTPGACPPSMLSRPVSSLLPQHIGPLDRASTRCGDQAGEPILDIGPQLFTDRKLRRLRTSCRSLCVPLRRAGTILQATAACGRVAPQLPRDGRSRPSNLPGDVAYLPALCAQQGDLLAFRER